MHSTSNATCSDRTSAAERGSVIAGSGRAQAARPNHRHRRSITGHSVSPPCTGRSPFAHLSPRTWLAGLGRSPAGTYRADPAPDRTRPAAHLTGHRAWVADGPTLVANQ